MSTIKVDTVRPVTADASLTLQGDSSGSGVTGLTIDSSGVVNTTTAKVTNIQATSGQSLTIKDEDGNAAITIGTDNTATSYLSLNFGSYHGGSGGAGSGTLTNNTLSDYEEGTFTPEIYDAASGGNQLTSSLNNYGAYTKIGNLVTIHFSSYNISRTGATAANTVYFRNLPFVAQSSSNHGRALGAVLCDSTVFGTGFLTAESIESVNYAWIRVMASNAIDTYLEVQDLSSANISDIEFSLTYRVI